MLMAGVAVVPGSSAASQTWELTNDSSGVPIGADYFMKKAVTPTGSVSLATGSSHYWVSDEASLVAMDLSGAWLLTVEWNDPFPPVNPSDVQVAIGVFSGSTCTGHSPLGAVTANGVPTVASATGMNVNVGDRICMRVFPSTAADLDVLTDGTSGAQSPSSDPGFPAPSLGSLVLLAVGALIVIGAVAYHRRK
jgi:hypothetical protein